MKYFFIALITVVAFFNAEFALAQNTAEEGNAPAYESGRTSESDAASGGEETDLADIAEKAPAMASSCNPVEYGGMVPFTAIVIPLDDDFYTIPKKAEWLPPDPGSEGKNTIAGIDADGDCVRDDIELHIARLLPSGDQIKARQYMFEYAKWRGRFLETDLSQASIKEIARNLYKSGECVRRILNDPAQSRILFDKIFSKFHDTFPRSHKYIENNALLGGWSTREDIVVSCP